MAYPVASYEQGGDNQSLQEIVIDLSKITYEVGDYLFVCVQSQRPSSNITEKTTSLWSRDSHQPSSEHSSAVFSREMTASESNPTFEQSGTAIDMYAVIQVVRGHNSAGTIIDSSTSSGDTDYYIDTTTVDTGANDNVLILIFTTSENRFDLDIPCPGLEHEIGADNDSGSAISCHSFIQQAAGTTPVFRIPSGLNGGDHTQHTIAIKDASTSQVKGFIDPANGGYTDIQPMTGTSSGVLNLFGDSSERISDPTTVIPDLDGETAIYNSFSSGNGSSGIINTKDYPNFLGITGTSNGDNKLEMWSFKIHPSNGLAAGGVIDLSDNIINLILTLSDTDVVAHNLGGMYLGVMSGDLTTGSARVWKVAALNTKVSPTKGIFSYQIDTSFTLGSTDFEDHGTPDLTNINRLIIGIHASNSTVFGVRFIRNLETLPLLGGSDAFPANFDDVRRYTQKNGLLTCSNQSNQTVGQFYLAQGLSIGNGVDYVNFKASNQSVELPAAYDVATLSTHAKLSAGAVPIIVHAAAGNVINLSAITLNYGNFHTYTEHASTHDSNIYNYNGFICLSSLVTLQGAKTNINRSGSVWSGCKQITHNAPTTSSTARVFNDTVVSNVAVGETAAIEAITTQEQFKNVVTGATFKNNTNAPAILITGNGHTGSWDDPGLTVSGNTTDIEYSGTATFSIQSAVTLTVTNTGGGSLTIVTPVNTFSINSDLSALIRRFTDDSQTIANSATATTLGYEYSNTDVIDIEVLKQGYVPVNRQDVTPINGDYDIVLDQDEAYNSGHSLNIDTEYAYVRETKVLTFNSDQQARNVYSSLSDEIRLDSAYFNTKLLMAAIGPTRFDLTVGMTVADMQYWKGAGSQIYDAADAVNPIEKWASIKSGGDITGSTTHYRQTDSGASTALTLTNNVVDEVLQFWSDPDHDGTATTDTSDYLLIKSFLAGSKQSRVDVLVSQGISALEPYAYAVSLANASHSYTGTDPGISSDITVVAGGTVGGKVFAYEIIDGGTNSGSDIADQLNYDAAANPNTVIPGGTLLRYFEMPDMVIYNTSAQETERGYKEGTTPALVGFYVSRSSADHPDFTRFQANDGTYYTPAVTANITITGLVDAGAQADDRLQVLNVTALTASAWQASNTYATGSMVLRTSGIGTEGIAGLYMRATTGGTSNNTEPTWDTTVGNTSADTNGAGAGNVVWTTYGVLLYDNDPAGTGYSASYIDGEEFATGDAYEIKFAEMDEGATFKIGRATGVTTVAGFTVSMELTADSVFASLGLDGSDYEAAFSPDFTNDYIVLDANIDFSGASAFAYYAYTLTTDQGMYQFWDGVTAIDTGNFRINTANLDLYFDESGGFVKQTDSVRVFRDDGARPAIDPTTGGNGIEINWRNPVYVTEVNTGSAVNQATVQAALAAQGYTSARAPELDKISTVLDDTNELQGNQGDWATGAGGGGLTASETRDALGLASADLDAKLAASVTATGFNTTAPDNASIAAIKAKTDKMVFTNSNQIDANSKSMNDAEIIGDGTESDPFRGLGVSP
jgi:hypothetical protein